MNQKDLEIFGNVKTLFPDGFQIQSEYLLYQPQEQRIFIPCSYPVKGFSPGNEKQSIHFTSQGLIYQMRQSQIFLPQAVQFVLENKTPSHLNQTTQKTQIQSDQCLIYRTNMLAKFTMDLKRPLSLQFVTMTQPTLLIQSRRADLYYQNFNQIIQVLTAYEDVSIQELDETTNPQTTSPSSVTLRYATAGKAEFHVKKNLITLTDFPQVYQNQDTITGDTILLYRDQDRIEVENSNAFSQGHP